MLSIFMQRENILVLQGGCRGNLLAKPLWKNSLLVEGLRRRGCHRGIWRQYFHCYAAARAHSLRYKYSAYLSVAYQFLKYTVSYQRSKQCLCVYQGSTSCNTSQLCFISIIL